MLNKPLKLNRMNTVENLHVSPTFGNTVLPAVVGSQTKYRTIVADPAWKYGKWGKASVLIYKGHVPKNVIYHTKQ